MSSDHPNPDPQHADAPSGLDLNFHVIIGFGVICVLLVIVLTLLSWAWVGYIEIGLFDEQVVDPEIQELVELRTEQTDRLHLDGPVRDGAFYRIDIDDAIDRVVAQYGSPAPAHKGNGLSDGGDPR
ncbi:MAG: hypothetical protein CMJ49_12485 [Planctomycetaceae bacterium]|nr:hypothetical protein [Planctomycetaceae bacterium]